MQKGLWTPLCMSLPTSRHFKMKMNACVSCCKRSLGTRRYFKMAAKPNCLIVCSSATQGMDKFTSVELSVKRFRGIKYLRFPKYLSHIYFCARKGKKTLNPFMSRTLVATVLTSNVWHSNIFFLFYGFQVCQLSLSFTHSHWRIQFSMFRLQHHK